MKAIDTNILVYAHREEYPQHPKAKSLLIELSEGELPWALPWPCVYEFLRVVSHPKGMNPPTSTDIAWANIESLFESPSLLLLHETERHPSILKQLLSQSGISGNLIHDAHIVALLIEYGIKEIITADGDFHRFEGIKVINPFKA